MKNRVKYLFTAALCCAFAGCLVTGTAMLSAHAEGYNAVDYSFTGTVQTGGVTLNVATDPYQNIDEAYGGILSGNRWQETTSLTTNANQTIVYTAAWRYTTSRREGNFTEYQVTPDGTSYKITAITDADTPAGSMYIPVGGFVVSAPSSVTFGKVNDAVSLKINDKTSQLSTFRLPTMAVESNHGDRVAIDSLNGNRSGPMVVYYDYQTGEKTGTNTSGTEMAAQYDEEKNAFVVTAFRQLLEGDDSGMVIPESGFVLSAYGEGFRGIFSKVGDGARFKIGDELFMVGFDYVRFGGSVTYTYDFINPTLEENPAGYDSQTSAPFPAYRGTNQLIVYKDGWNYNGAAGTGTNVYGFEVAVNEHGVVSERGVNVSKIPEGGYVLSGHGKGRDFLQSNVPMGATVELNEKTKTFTATTSLNSFYTNVASSLSDAVKTAQDRITRLYDLNVEALEALFAEGEAARANMEALKDEVLSNDPQGAERTRMLMRFNSLQLAVEEVTRNIVAASMESAPVGARAVWHRPIERSLSALRETLKVYRDCGINLVFVESFYGGMSLFKSEYVPYHVDFKNATYEGYTDYLSAFVGEAEKYGIEVHAWVEDFYVGISESQGVYAEHPEWVMYNDDGTIRQRNEGGEYIFIDPANPAVQDLLISFYKEMVEKVPGLKGLNLDYIRYPVSSREQDTGYTEAAMRGFAEKMGLTVEGNDIATYRRNFGRLFNRNYTPSAQANANYTAWVEYRTQIISDFVLRVRNEVKGESELLLSTAVFPSINESKQNKKQDWQTWFQKGWIEIATPMAYYDSPTDVRQYVHEMIQMAGTNCYYYTGLASSYRGLPAYQNANQVDASYLAGANGYVIFCSTQILGHEDVQNVLKAGINSADAVLPHADVQTVLKAYFDRIAQRAEKLYIPSGGMTEEKLAALNAEFEKLLAMPASSTGELRALSKALTTLRETVSGTSDYALGYSRQRITATLQEAENLLSIKLERSILEKGDEPLPEIPPTENPPGENPPGENPPGENPPGENPPEENPPTENPPKKKGCRGEITTVGAGAAVALIAVVAFIVMKKKRI